MSPRPFIVAVDFDGTVVEHEFPAVGADVPGAVAWLVRLAAAGAHFVLWTARTQGHLKAAVQWFEDRGIPLAGVNRYSGQEFWAGGPKVYAGLYIDDAALGAPLVRGAARRPYLDWGLAGPAALAALREHVQ